MAILIPSLASCEAKMQSGEKRVANILRSKLNDDSYCWYNVPVGKDHKHSDFIILNPKWGILVLEVKDWELDTIVHCNKETFTLNINGENVKKQNPLEQARNYVFNIKDRLVTDTNLLISEGKYQGNLCFPYAYGVIFTRINRKQFNQKHFGDNSLNDVFEDSPLVLCSNEFAPGTSAEDIQDSLRGMFKFSLTNRLSKVQIDNIRWHIFPEMRVTRSLKRENKVEQLGLPILCNSRQMMDINQEQLAKSMGTGHRVIHGAAGSGKTMLLCYRAQYLDNYLDDLILILCFSRRLAKSIRNSLREKNVSNRVKVQTFHAWCVSQLKKFNIPVVANEEDDTKDFFESCVEKLTISIANQTIPPHQYGSILIDEGNDFEESWFKLVVQMVKPENNNLLVLYDSAQSIFGNQKKIKTFSSVGIQARGRTNILKINYRNTYEIFTVATKIAGNVLQAIEGEDDTIPLVEPVCADIRGPLPQLIYQPSHKEEYEAIATLIKAKYLAGYHWGQVAVITRNKQGMHKIIQTIFEQFQIPLSDENNEDGVSLLTMHGSKGLEFPLVYIPAVGYQTEQQDSIDEETRLLYVAMTRATEELIMTYGDNSYFAPKIKAILAEFDN